MGGGIPFFSLLSPTARPRCARGDGNSGNLDLASDSDVSVVHLDPFCHLAPIFRHLWKHEGFSRVNYCRGWYRVPTNSVDPPSRAISVWEEWPRIGVGGAEKKQGGTISGDSRDFARIAMESSRISPIRGTHIEEQGAGRRMRRDQGNDYGRTQG